MFRQKRNPLQALEAAKAKKKENNKPIVAFIALLTVSLIGAYLGLGTPKKPGEDQTDQAAQDPTKVQAALIQTDHPSTADGHSSGPPASAQVADAFTQVATTKPTELATPSKPRA